MDVAQQTNEIILTYSITYFRKKKLDHFYFHNSANVDQIS